MSVYRVHQTKDYTVMSNVHLKDKRMSLKAKGLLSVMLSLPEDWDYSVNGLCAILKENQSAVKSTLEELKECGYLVITKLTPNETKSGRIEYEYDIFETPQVKQEGEKQGIEIQPLEIQPLEIQAVENHTQLNTKESITKESITDYPEEEEEERAREDEHSEQAPEEKTTVCETVERYATENIRYMSPTAMQELVSFVEDLPPELVRHAIDAACDQGVRTWAYVRSILNRYIDDGVKSVGEAKEREEKWHNVDRRNPARYASGNTGTGRCDDEHRGCAEHVVITDEQRELIRSALQREAEERRNDAK